MVTDRRTYVDKAGAIVELRRTRSHTGREVWVANSTVPTPQRPTAGRTTPNGATGPRKLERRSAGTRTVAEARRLLGLPPKSRP